MTRIHINTQTGSHAPVFSHLQELAEEPRTPVSPTAECADHCVCAVEQDAQHLSDGGDSPGEREARLGGAVSGTSANDGRFYPRGEQVMLTTHEYR